MAALAACGDTDVPPRQCGTPGAGWVAFIDRTTGPFAIRIAHEDGYCTRTVAADPGGALGPSWSAAARKLAYVGTDGGGETSLRVHDFVSGVTTTVAVAPLVPGSVALSPDGGTIAFEARVGIGNPALYTVPAAGGEPALVSSTTASDAGPAWGPDGATTLYFVSSRAGPFEIWSIGATGLDPTLVTSRSGVLGRPAVSPDGTRLAYARQKLDGSSQVIERDLATGVERVLSDERDGEPAYDATGSRIAVSTFRFGGGADVAVLDAATGALRARTTAGAGTSGAPAFPR